jgi:hypothetical protein
MLLIASPSSIHPPSPMLVRVREPGGTFAKPENFLNKNKLCKLKQQFYANIFCSVKNNRIEAKDSVIWDYIYCLWAQSLSCL